MKIEGKIAYQNLGSGLWGIISNDGQRYEPVNMPEQLKYEGRSVSITAKKSNGFSLFMWGTPIYITAFHTL